MLIRQKNQERKFYFLEPNLFFFLLFSLGKSEAKEKKRKQVVFELNWDLLFDKENENFRGNGKNRSLLNYSSHCQRRHG